MRAANRRAAVVAAAALLTVVLTANLGAWQLRRAAQKVALQTAIDDRAGLPVLGATDLMAAGGTDALPTLHFRRVHLQGRWLAADTLFLDNRQMNARVGFYVVTPLQLADRPEAVLVQRGWVPRDMRDRTLLPPIATPNGLVEVDGTIAPPPARLYEFAASASGVIRQNLDLPAFAVQTGLRLLPLSIQQADPKALSATEAPAGRRDESRLRRDWARPAVNVDMHYGYAFQWFALCALTVGLFVWFQILRPWLARRHRR